MAGEPINGDPAGQENLVELFNINIHLQNMHCLLHLRHHHHPHHHHHTDDPDHDNCSLVEGPFKEAEGFAIFVELCKSCLAAAALYKMGFISGDDVIIATATNITTSNTQLAQYHHQRQKNAEHLSSNSDNHDYHHHHQIITVIILVITHLHTQEDLCETRCVPRSESSTLRAGENQGCSQT